MRGPKVKITSGRIDAHIFIDDNEIKEIAAYAITHSAGGQPILYLKTVLLGVLDFEGCFNEVYDIGKMLNEKRNSSPYQKFDYVRTVFFSALGAFLALFFCFLFA